VGARGNDRRSDGAIELDDLDRSILHALQLDGRRAYRDIARDLEVPEATVRFRANRLQRDGVLRILGFVDTNRLGRVLMADVLLRVAPAHRSQVGDALAGWPEVMYVAHCTGLADIFIQIVCDGPDRLRTILNEELPELPGIEHADTMITLQVRKTDYVYPNLG